MAFITCSNVSFAYEGNIAVSGLDFEVSKGDYLCVVGENGSGKEVQVGHYLLGCRFGYLLFCGGYRLVFICYAYRGKRCCRKYRGFCYI